MLLWVYAIVVHRDRPIGWERPCRVERPQGGAPAGAVVGRAAAIVIGRRCNPTKRKVMGCLGMPSAPFDSTRCGR
jgi:hypothetical protein